jgi:hypothetical protein
MKSWHGGERLPGSKSPPNGWHQLVYERLGIILPEHVYTFAARWRLTCRDSSLV